jgi:hypothetical protein
MRYEPVGKLEMMQVADGTHLHTIFNRPPGFQGGPRGEQHSDFQDVPRAAFLPA